MRPISGWRHLMNTSVSVAPLTGRDVTGKPTYGTAVVYPAHIGRQRKYVLTSAGANVVSNQSVWLATAAPILPTAQVTLSTADVGSTAETAVHPLIVGVERLSDQRGNHHVVLNL